ncbi:MAG: hypothetical protein WBZ40_04030 [Acidimicrobiia bacterium]
MRRGIVMFFLMLLAVTACGGSGSDSNDGGTQPETKGASPARESDGENSTNTTAIEEPSSNGPLDSGVHRATVTLDGETYQFGHTTFVGENCSPDLFGIFRVQLLMVDDAGNEHPSGSDFLLELLHEDADPDVVEGTDARNRVTLSIADAVEEWVADAEEIDLRGLDPGTSQVDDYTFDGNSVSGTATFFELGSEGEWFAGNADSYSVAKGTFEVTCAG